MIPLKQWLASPEIQEIKSQPMGKLVSKTFFRDPLRPIYIDPNYFYAPADGVILYIHENIKPNEAIVEIKGKKFTIKEALDDHNYNKPSLVIGIFMSQYDVHINRMPTSGYVTQEHSTPFLFTPNISMILEEEHILQHAEIDKEDMNYLFCNERKIVTVYCPKIKGQYYLIQIAEKDVDVILNWSKQGHLIQGDRYGLVRFGSQVDLIIPLTGKTKYEILAKKHHHVEAGKDKIIKIINP